MAGPVPLISLEENAKGPVLRYDIPEPTSYSGFNLIELDLDVAGPVFKQALMDDASSEAVASMRGQSVETIQKRLTGYFANGLGGGEFGLATGPGASIPKPDDRPNPLPLPDDPTRPPNRFGEIQFGDLAQKVKEGERIVVTDNPNGDTNVSTIPEPEVIEPKLYLVETIRMTTFLGDYGAGRVVKTLSLLPGETTRISVKTFRQTEASTKKSSSILDSVTKESADDMQNVLQSEQSDQKGYQKSKEYYADISAKASWGWGSAKAKAGIKGSSNATREESVKNISSATEKHTSKASAKREVQVNSNYEVTQKDGEETAIERDIENINVSRTLNFVFRQMNQAFVTFIHLTDVRIGYFNGLRESRREVPISGLDSLLEDTIRPGKIDNVRTIILEQLKNIRNFEGNIKDVVKEVEISANDKYRLFDNALKHVYEHPKTGGKYEVPGVILAVNDYVMRTEGVIVESILGEGVALDQYATKLQDAEVSRRNASVRRDEAMAEREVLINNLASSADEAKAKILSDLICPCGEHPKDSEAP